MSLKNSVTPPGIEPGTVRIVAVVVVVVVVVVVEVMLQEFYTFIAKKTLAA